MTNFSKLAPKKWQNARLPRLFDTLSARMSVRICDRMSIRISVRMSALIYMRMNVSMYVHLVFVCRYEYMNIGIYVCVYVCINGRIESANVVRGGVKSKKGRFKIFEEENNLMKKSKNS